MIVVNRNAKKAFRQATLMWLLQNKNYLIMFNPEIIKKQNSFETEEACLSLQGYPKKTKRYKIIKVRWQNEKFEWRIKTFTGWTAQIIQHEIDHCDGILI